MLFEVVYKGWIISSLSPLLQLITAQLLQQLPLYYIITAIFSKTSNKTLQVTMKYAAVAVAFLATFAVAAPPPQCKPGTYACTKNPKTGRPGWEVCNTSGKFVVSHDIFQHSPFGASR
jgi:hypothetical protein